MPLIEVVLGVGLLFAGVVALILARPKDGKPRSFVGTNLEIPIALSILGAITVGAVLTIGGLVAFGS